MPQLPFGFDPDAGTFANVKLPPPRVNNRYSGATASSADSSTCPVSRPQLSWWQRYDRFISDIGNWFSENYDETVDRLSAWLYIIMFVGAVIAVILTWISSGFWSAVFVAIGAMIGLGLFYYVASIVLPIVTGAVMFAGRFIFWNSITLLIFLSVVIGGAVHRSMQPTQPAKEKTEAAAPAPATQTYTCTAAVLNVRSQPNTSCAVLGALRKGQTVEVLGTEGDFARIDYRGRTGYVSTRYLQSAGDK